MAYQLLSKESKILGDYEIARQFEEKITEVKRRFQLVQKKALLNRKIMIDEAKLLELSDEAKEALEIAIIAEGEHRWGDAIKFYQIVVEKNQELGDFERAWAFEEKVIEIKRISCNKI